MSILKKAENTQAYSKIGLMGFAGSGKTFTAMEIAFGIKARLGSTAPIAFMDTETGSDFFVAKCKERGIDLLQAKTRAFSDALKIFSEAQEAGCDVIIIDSVTHIWKELCDAYAKKRNVSRLRFQDWATLKMQWGNFTDLFVNAPIHTIIAGRAGYEYDYHDDGDGKMELHKTGTKMKAEGEFGYEPSMLIEMERVKRSSEKDPTLKGWIHRATILKDRTDTIDGKVFDDPDFSAFEPHFAKLNVGGHHLGVDITRDSTELFNSDGDTRGDVRRKQKAIAIAEMKGLIDEQWPGTSGDMKKAKNDCFVKVFSCRSWEALEAKTFDEIKADHVALVKYVNKIRQDEGMDPADWVTMPDYTNGHAPEPAEESEAA